MKTTPTFLLLLLVIALAGCAPSTYDRLAHETDDLTLRRLIEANQDRSTSTVHYSTQPGNRPEADLAVHVTGRENAERGIILLHGCSSDAQTWRFVSGDLGADHTLILVDLLGCGMSDRPDPASLAPDGYSPDAMAERILQALTALKDDGAVPERLTLVGHSLGGAIALRMMGSQELRAQHAALLSRVDRMVLLTPLDVEFVNPPASLMRIAKISMLEIQLGTMLGLLREAVATGVYEAAFDHRFALREDVDRLITMLTQRDSLRANQAILWQARPLQDEELDWDAARRITADYANIDVPCAILWGADDDVLPVAMGHKLAHEIPTADLHLIADCKHSAQIEKPLHCADAIRRFSAANEPFALDLSFPRSQTALRRDGASNLTASR